jgi:hypothetical protein
VIHHDHLWWHIGKAATGIGECLCAFGNCIGGVRV